ncbi:hypothetical protein KP509_29G038500 [Ceratopteris richardii]|uniref:AMP-activated protein kinase glycogen-binding domain-containing protein n=2 Tax=Ceratopteris richardii TaxID=49495 RepID=A0A8T2R8K3_CERRI|nr:hypothetical protein KP509_29G038500 [Ceratopteris richardii]
MACLSSIQQAITRLQAVSSSQLQLEPVCMARFKPPLDRKLQSVVHFKKSGVSIQSALGSRLLAFAAAAGQDVAAPTLVLQEVDFVWKGEGSQVFLTGDFLNWEAKVPLAKGEDGAFHCKQKLPAGTYVYKYIVDGNWTHSADSPTIEDGQGGFNNQLIVTDGPSPSMTTSNKEKPPKDTTSEKITPEAAPKVASASSKPSAAVPKAAPAAKPAKKVEKPYPEVITEDVIPQVVSELQKQEGVSDISIGFQDNQMEGSFIKNGILYTFWAFFPDGTLQGNRGFSISSHGAPPSTVEPFLIDEKKITAELLVFWTLKRLAAQKIIIW